MPRARHAHPPRPRPSSALLPSRILCCSNLYTDGKVCLSLLGTWAGPGWVPETSTLSQVLLALQAQILVDSPLVNEPGHEGYASARGTNIALQKHTVAVRLATLRYGMLAVLRSPPRGFEAAVKLHFWLKRDEISALVRRWAAEAAAYSAYEFGLADRLRTLRAAAAAVAQLQTRALAELREWHDSQAASQHVFAGPPFPRVAYASAAAAAAAAAAALSPLGPPPPVPECGSIVAALRRDPPAAASTPTPPTLSPPPPSASPLPSSSSAAPAAGGSPAVPPHPHPSVAGAPGAAAAPAATVKPGMSVEPVNILGPQSGLSFTQMVHYSGSPVRFALWSSPQGAAAAAQAANVGGPSLGSPLFSGYGGPAMGGAPTSLLGGPMAHATSGLGAGGVMAAYGPPGAAATMAAAIQQLSQLGGGGGSATAAAAAAAISAAQHAMAASTSAAQHAMAASALAAQQAMAASAALHAKTMAASVALHAKAMAAAAQHTKATQFFATGGGGAGAPTIPASAAAAAAPSPPPHPPAAGAPTLTYSSMSSLLEAYPGAGRHVPAHTPPQPRTPWTARLSQLLELAGCHKLLTLPNRIVIDKRSFGEPDSIGSPAMQAAVLAFGAGQLFSGPGGTKVAPGEATMALFRGCKWPPLAPPPTPAAPAAAAATSPAGSTGSTATTAEEATAAIAALSTADAPVALAPPPPPVPSVDEAAAAATGPSLLLDSSSASTGSGSGSGSGAPAAAAALPAQAAAASSASTPSPPSSGPSKKGGVSSSVFPIRVHAGALLGLPGMQKIVNVLQASACVLRRWVCFEG